MADTIWKRFGNVENYVEPFAGSIAVLLANPNPSKIETVNDIDCYIANFFRALALDPDNVIKYADNPVNEADLHARQTWLLSSSTNEWRAKMHSDPDHYDSKIAGWWVWGICASIGTNWLQSKNLNSVPHLSSAGQGIHGITKDMSEWLNDISKRIRSVRVTCGDWSRVVTKSVTYNSVGLSKDGITGILLDPPYLLSGRDKVYNIDDDVFTNVCKWAVDNESPKMRIAVCGHDGTYDFPDTWTKYSWQSNGYGSMGNDRGRENAKKEVIWFSQSCIKV